ncbi:hypothetical protein Cgig2_004677 [Carnegiea gigantea]|uniref:Histidine decarboxylase n=1 Tax=Carnegiea gigantea TaxID=171969 RepID=A0A9Q1QAE6_9CARY|nr:hypothetical protein Cgig2_004677 [Carnegiea gigantea]
MASDKAGRESDVVHCRNVRQSGLRITEPAEVDKEYMASVFANCTQTWLESIKYHLGYQLDFNFDYAALNTLQPFPLNNFGDPFTKSNYGVNSKQFEVGVLDWFAHLWEIENDEYWGYVTSGGTEANLQGILMGFAQLHYQVNIGTTFKGAIDDLDLVIQTLAECGFSRNQFYIHCDGALFGIMLPFVEQAPQITFKKPIDSASVSGHKLLGCPMPCGVLITRIEHVNALSKDIEYIASRDVTITCSRSGHAPILLWYILSKKGRIGLQKDIQKCLQNAKYLRDRLRNAGVSVMLNELSNIVVFERPPDEEFIKRWQLSCQGNIGHIVVMVNVSKQKLDAFLDELTEKLSTWSKEGAHRCVAFDIGYENCVCLLHSPRRGYCFCFFYRISFDNNNRGRDNGDNRGHVLYNNWRGWLWSRGGSYSNNNASTESQPSNRSVPA